ncbi:MAG: CNP1-like family protein [Rhodocyclaceae bacterium]|nr:CNP1-like family protein [Rhodocyclaceae bacterium]
MRGEGLAFCLRAFYLAAILLFARPLQAQLPARVDFEEEAKVWQEEEVALPTHAPQEEHLLPLYVSATTPHRFFVDGSTLRIGGDGVVRYVLVVQSAAGARSVSFEGIRCATREWRLYATLSPTTGWVRARLARWQPIENKPMNRQHAALFRDHFCPDGVPVASAEAAKASLMRDAQTPLAR